MPFSFTNYQPGTMQQTNPYANAAPQALGAYSQAVKAKYQPQMTQAEIIGKALTPLAQFATSPMGMVLTPGQQGQMRNLISQIMGGFGGNGTVPTGDNGASQISGMPIQPGGAGQPTPAGTPAPQGSGTQPTSTNASSYDQNGDNIKAPLTFNDGTPAPAPTSGINPNLPDPHYKTGVGQQVTAPAANQLHPAGEGYRAPNNEGMVASPATQVEHGAQVLDAATNVKALAPELKAQAHEFFKTGANVAWFKDLSAVQMGQAGLSPRLRDKLDKNPGMAARWTTFTNTIGRVSNQLQKIYPISATDQQYQKHMEMLTKHPGDTEEEYNNRIDALVKELDEVNIPNAKKMMGGKGGYNINPDSSTAYGMTGQDNNVVPQAPAAPETTGAPQAPQVANLQQTAANDYAMIGGPPGPKNPMGVREVKTVNGQTRYRIGEKWYKISGMMGASGAQ